MGDFYFSLGFKFNKLNKDDPPTKVYQGTQEEIWNGDAKVNVTPMGTNTRPNEDLKGTQVNQTHYHGMIVSVLYRTTNKPNITFSVGFCARFRSNPQESQLSAVKKILWYLIGIDDLCLFNRRSNV